MFDVLWNNYKCSGPSKVLWLRVRRNNFGFILGTSCCDTPNLCCCKWLNCPFSSHQISPPNFPRKSLCVIKAITTIFMSSCQKCLKELLFMICYYFFSLLLTRRSVTLVLLKKLQYQEIINVTQWLESRYCFSW